MHMAAVAWFIPLNGWSFACSFLSALNNPTGLRVNSTPSTSASASRRRDSARRMSGPKMNPTTASSAAGGHKHQEKLIAAPFVTLSD